MVRPLPGMVVAITGASAGIGRALALALAGRGCRLALCARRVELVSALCTEVGGDHLAVRTDVGSPAQCEAFVDQTHQRFGQLDTLVCNAGYGLVQPVAESEPADFDRIFRVNVRGTLDCIRAAVPILKRQALRGGWRGQIVIVSSAAARRGLPFFGAYSATKAAQLSLAEALRVELRQHQIAVTTVHPIGTETEFFTVAQRPHDMRVPVPGLGETRQTAADVAKAVVRAVERPRPEVWPHGPSRYALSLATLWPSLADRIMARYRGDLDCARRGQTGGPQQAGGPSSRSGDDA